MDARTAIAKYLNESWTADERAEIVEYGAERAAELYGEHVLPEQEEPSLPDIEQLADMVFGPTTPAAKMHYTAMTEEADHIGRYEPQVLQEEAEWHYLSQFFDDAEVYGTWKFNLYTDDAKIQLVSRTCDDGDGAVEGEKGVRISLDDIDYTALQDMDAADYTLHVAVDAPDEVTVDVPSLDPDEIRSTAEEQARNQVAATGDHRITSDFPGGRLDTGKRRHQLILHEYTRTDHPEADHVLDLVNL